jgi:hypothetical protein
VSPAVTVKVECYSGYTFAERPTGFVWGGKRHQIERILAQWRLPEGPGFRVVTTDGTQFKLTYNEIQDQWLLYLPP